MKRNQLLLMTGLLSLLWISNLNAQNARSGDIAPHFTINTISGKSFSLDAHKGKVVLVNFFSTVCRWCIKELPKLEKDVFLKYRKRNDFQIIAVARGQQKSTVEKFIRQRQLTLPVAYDPQQHVFRKYAEKMIPRTYVIGKDGKIKQVLVGYTEAEFKQLLKVIEYEFKK
ncbi:hypothetical protein BKI52_15550 [marine bacterium AO1-C]|nr:hypothetical protein BKI52_15550 [marine bacterium AO1-C]